MWNIKYPDNLSTKATFEIAFPKNKIHCKINSKHNDIYKLYSLYIKNRGIPSTALSGGNIADNILDAIFNSYNLTQKGRLLEDVRKTLKKIAPNNKCTYCGIGRPNTLDHYLPHTEYKVFSIHTHNLVPSCQECNRKKSTTASTNINEQYLHAYLHTLPNTTILQGDLEILNPGFLFRFSIIGGNPNWDYLIDKAKFQFNTLELDNDFQEEANTFMFDQRVSFEKLFAQGDLNDHLAKNYLLAIKGYGLNHWKTAIWRALLLSVDFCTKGPARLY